MATKEKLTTWDPADQLKSEEDISLYLEACQQDGDPELIAAALADIARARTMNRLAEDADMTRAGLYKALKPGANPSLRTVAKVANAMGLQLVLQPKTTKAKTAAKKPAARKAIKKVAASGRAKSAAAVKKGAKRKAGAA